MKDAASKRRSHLQQPSSNRYRQAENNSQAKLTCEKVRIIRERAALGESHTVLAIAFGVAARTVSWACQGHSWKNAGGPIMPFRAYKDRVGMGRRKSIESRKS